MTRLIPSVRGGDGELHNVEELDGYEHAQLLGWIPPDQPRPPDPSDSRALVEAVAGLQVGL